VSMGWAQRASNMSLMVLFMGANSSEAGAHLEGSLVSVTYDTILID
jgi:hypothetical protein